MELKIKKRIVGFLLLIALGLIFVPLFFGRSITSDELTLSSHVPNRPEKPSDITMPVPKEEATMAEVPLEALPQSIEQSANTKPQPVSIPATPPSRIVFEKMPGETSNKSSSENLTESQPVLAPVPEIEAVTPSSATSATTSSEKQKESAAIISKPAPIPSAVTPSTKNTEVSATPESWVVQVGSFSDKKNATTLMKKIQSVGMPAYIETSKTSKGSSFRVLVGPELQKSAANTMQAKLVKWLNITGIVVKATR